MRRTDTTTLLAYLVSRHYLEELQNVLTPYHEAHIQARTLKSLCQNMKSLSPEEQGQLYDHIVRSIAPHSMISNLETYFRLSDVRDAITRTVRGIDRQARTNKSDTAQKPAR